MKVSIIIPCHNVEGYILDCISSVINQTYKKLEIICVDDGSTDQTLKIIQAYQSSYVKDMIIISQDNKGASSARNVGLSASSGEYIQFLDADDILKPNKIKRQIDLVMSNNSPEIIVGSFDKENMLGHLIDRKTFKVVEQSEIWLKMMQTKMGQTSSNLYKVSCFRKGICWNEHLPSSQEYDLMFQMLKVNANVCFDSEINTIIRLRDYGSITQLNLKRKWEIHAKLKIDIFKFITKHKPHLMSNGIHQSLFDSIRLLYPYNSKLALAHFKAYLGSHFQPEKSDMTGTVYLLSFKFLGFKRTEKLRQILCRTVPQ